MALPKKKYLGRFIVIDPDVCHGKPTFAGTRIMVEQILKQVAGGEDWDEIVTEWRGSIAKEAIGEAVDLACQTFTKFGDKTPAT
jgi:uncharacterized protein (DUF433 family)